MYNEQMPVVRRRSATPEDLATRRQGNAPPRPRNTEEDKAVHTAPRSSLRHRPIGDMYVIPFTDGSEIHVTERELEGLPENYQNAARLIQPQVTVLRQRRQLHPTLPAQDDTVDELPPAHARDTERLPRQRSLHFPHFHWPFWTGLALVFMLVGWVTLTYLSSWWTTQTNDWTYGRPRTFQIDANVGHGTAANPDSHFIAENLNKHLIVIEIPGDDPTHTRIYIGPTLIGEGQELTPVTLSFEDVNTDGKPDLVLHVGDSKFIFLNTGAGFKVAPNQ